MTSPLAWLGPNQLTVKHQIYNTNPATATAATINPAGANMLPALSVVEGLGLVVVSVELLPSVLPSVGVSVEVEVSVLDGLVVPVSVPVAVPVAVPVEAVEVWVEAGAEVLSPPAETHQEVTVD